jgi:ABC-type nitrate/sulfonate/bicarbonate transport system ATPase subunit
VGSAVTAVATAADRSTRGLHIAGLVKNYRVRRETRPALDGVDLHVAPGELVAIVGASGCGKSTLLRIVAGLEEPTGGAVDIDGDAIVGPGPDRGMVFQSYTLFPWRTVAENVGFGLECTSMPRKARKARVDELLGVVGLAAYSNSMPNELSGGMRQRVAIARAMAPDPDILLLDEPFGALDAQTRRSMQEFLHTVWRRTGSTILFVTHDIDEALYLGQRVYVMASNPGRVRTIIDVPFGASRGPSVKRDPRFLDLRDEIEDLLDSAEE